MSRWLQSLSAAAVLWLGAVVVLTSDSGVDILALFLGVFGAAGLGVTWLATAVVHRVRRRDSAHSPGAWMWTVVPASIGLALCLTFVSGPGHPLFRLRFRLSEPALRREAQRVIKSADHVSEDRRIGLFRVQRLSVFEGTVRFITTPCAVVDSCGVVYSPQGEPKRWQEDHFTHITGPWWHVFEGF